MLSAHRRHLRTCEHAAKGWNYTLCDCPVWCAGMLNGRRVRKSLDTTNWERALRRMQAWERGGEEPPESVATGITLDRAIQAFLASRAQNNLQPSTIRNYNGTLDPIRKALGARPLAEISITARDEYLNTRTMAPRTRAKQIRHLRALFTWCVEREMIAANPARKIRPPRISD